ECRAAASAQAAAASRADRGDAPPDRAERADHRTPLALLPARLCEDGDRAGARQEALRQARIDRGTRSTPRDAAPKQRPPGMICRRRKKRFITALTPAAFASQGVTVSVPLPWPALY